MGSDKALLPVEGMPMAERVARALRDSGCREVVCIGGDEQALTALGLRVVSDQFPGEGPLGGVITALAHFAGEQSVAVVACDLPFVSAATVRRIAESVGSHQVAVARASRLQPLCAVWRPSVAPLLDQLFGFGERRMVAALASLDVVEVAVDEIDLANVNTADDLRQ